jgi:hypothetical protein
MGWAGGGGGVEPLSRGGGVFIGVEDINPPAAVSTPPPQETLCMTCS